MSLHEAHDRSVEKSELAIFASASTTPKESSKHWLFSRAFVHLANLSEMVVSLAALLDVAWTETKSGQQGYKVLRVALLSLELFDQFVSDNGEESRPAHPALSSCCRQ